MFIGDVAINKHSTIYANDHTSVTKINKLITSNGKNCFTKKNGIFK